MKGKALAWFGGGTPLYPHRNKKRLGFFLNTPYIGFIMQKKEDLDAAKY